MMVSHGQRGFSAYCFKCGQTEFQPHKDRNLAQLQEAKAARDYRAAGKAASLPVDFTGHISSAGYAWLGSGGITVELSAHYGIGYSPALDRVVIPVYWKGKLSTVQCRALHQWQRPKYINPAGSSRTAVFKSDDAVMLPSAEPRAGTCVIVEDVLSAIRVGRHQTAYAALGTSLSSEAVLDIINNYKTVILWFDGDTAGEHARYEVGKQLFLCGIEVRHIRTSKDPKRLTNEEIKEHLNAGHNSPADKPYP